VPTFEVEGDQYESVELTVSELEAHDCVIILTDHSQLDVELIVNHGNLVFDTRNVTSSGKNVRKI